MLTLINFIANVCIAAALFINRRAFAGLFAQEEEEVLELVVEIVPLLALFFMTYFGTAFGVIIATGLQKYAAPFAFLFTYAIALPIAIILGFNFEMGPKGFWIAVLIAVVGQVLANFTIVTLADW